MSIDKIKSLYNFTKYRCNNLYHVKFEWNNYYEFKNWLLNNGYICGKSKLKRINKKGNYSPNNCIVFNEDWKYLDINTINEIIELYKLSKSAIIVSKKFNINHWNIIKILKANKIEINKGNSVKKYEYNEDYFEKIDTEEKSYLARFFLC